MAEWDPPFPIELNRVREKDEDYWHQYRTTPKAFITLPVAQNLWQTRFGNLTSIRIESAGQIRSAQTILAKSCERDSIPRCWVSR